MVSMGKPYSRYRSFNDAVSLTIFIAIDNAQFVKFITEVQDKNSKIMPLAEMMILRNLMDNRKEQLSELSRKVQKSLDETKKLCNELVNRRLIEIVGKELCWQLKFMRRHNKMYNIQGIKWFSIARLKIWF